MLTSRRGASSGFWEPLPHIYSGLVVYPYHPSGTVPNSPSSTVRSQKHRFSWSGVSSVASRADDVFSHTRGNPHEVSLDVGDEFFAFEEYRGDDVEGSWYRGYVTLRVVADSQLCGSRRLAAHAHAKLRDTKRSISQS